MTGFQYDLLNFHIPDPQDVYSQKHLRFLERQGASSWFFLGSRCNLVGVAAPADLEEKV